MRLEPHSGQNLQTTDVAASVWTASLGASATEEEIVAGGGEAAARARVDEEKLELEAGGFPLSGRAGSTMPCSLTIFSHRIPGRKRLKAQGELKM